MVFEVFAQVGDEAVDGWFVEFGVLAVEFEVPVLGWWHALLYVRVEAVQGCFFMSDRQDWGSFGPL